jgi:bromodomain and WD repeat domain-containing protein 1/3
MMSSSNIESELYYLVAKYLESGPCHRSAQLLKKEIEENCLLPKRFDWLGRQHDCTFDEVNRQNTHISCDHLFKIVQRTNGLLDAVISPSVSGVSTLLGDGRQSLLRDKSNSINRLRSSLQLSSFRNGSQMLPSAQSIASHPHNIGINCFEFCKI